MPLGAVESLSVESAVPKRRGRPPAKLGRGTTGGLVQRCASTGMRARGRRDLEAGAPEAVLRSQERGRGARTCRPSAKRKASWETEAALCDLERSSIAKRVASWGVAGAADDFAPEGEGCVRGPRRRRPSAKWRASLETETTFGDEVSEECAWRRGVAGEERLPHASTDLQRIVPTQAKEHPRVASGGPPAEAVAAIVPCSEHPGMANSSSQSTIFRRSKRVPGGNPMDKAPFRRLIGMIRGNSRKFQAQGRILRLKQYMLADANTAQIEEVISALSENTRVQVLYIQNFEDGLLDRQLALLTEVLKKGRIWALNIGENFNISLGAWETFTQALAHTNVSFMYVSEQHLVRTNLKNRMIDTIRENRRKLPRQDPKMIPYIKNMWWNPCNSILYCTKKRR